MTWPAKTVLILIVLICIPRFWLSTLSPSHDRDWAFDQAVLPTADILGDIATVHDVRNFSYTTATSAVPVYETRTYDLSKIARTWYVVVPFGAPGVAHAFVSFEFDDGQYVSVSVEARKEEGEVFSPIKGAFRAYEFMYVIGDERDVIGVRANERGHDVYLYPLTLSREQTRTVFESMLSEVNAIAETPVFYNTFTGSCMTGVADHFKKAGIDIPLSIDFLLPAYSDQLFFDMGLIDTDLSFEEAKQLARINDQAAEYADSVDFSVGIRSAWADEAQ